MAVIRAMAFLLLFGVACGYLVAQVDPVIGVMMAATIALATIGGIGVILLSRIGNMRGARHV